MKIKLNNKNMGANNTIKQLFFVLALLPLFFSGLIAQEEGGNKKDIRPIRSTFESASLIDNQTVMVPIKGTFEFDIQHRFGTWNNGYDDLYGLFAPSNIRLGFAYSILDRVSLGFGITKLNMAWDFNVKYAFLKQTRSGNIPLSITYYGNGVVDTRSKDKFTNASDRLSYFHQIILARKFTRNFSVQVAPSLSHFNAVEAYINSEGVKEGLMKNDHLAVSFSGRYKINGAISIIANFDQPITKHKSNNPLPNISLGIELTSSSHAFQIFAGNYYAITPQRNNVFNSNDYRDSQFVVGFNISRLWNF